MSDPVVKSSPEDKVTEPIRKRPWGPASYWRIALVVFAVIVAVLLFLRM